MNRFRDVLNKKREANPALRKQFFFEKKNQKTSFMLGYGRDIASANGRK
jgi:hypothetical protein